MFCGILCGVVWGSESIDIDVEIKQNSSICQIVAFSSFHNKPQVFLRLADSRYRDRLP